MHRRRFDLTETVMPKRAACPFCELPLSGRQLVRPEFRTPDRHVCPECGETFQLDPSWECLGGVALAAAIVLPLVLAMIHVIGWLLALVAAAVVIALVVPALPYLSKAIPADQAVETPREWLVRRGWFSRANYWRMWAIVVAAVAILTLGADLVRDSFHWFLAFFRLIVIPMMLAILASAGYRGLFLPFALRENRVPARRELRSAWSVLVVTTAAAMALCHFVFGSSLWITSTWGKLAFSYSYVAAFGWPCFALLALSAVTFVFALARRRIVVPLLLAVLILSAAAFWYDVANERWQWEISIARLEYWEQGGRAHGYYTWWWY